MTADASDTRPDSGSPDPLALTWSARWSLTTRILAVNVLALALLAGGFFYLDSYRTRLVDAELARLEREATVAAAALSQIPHADQDKFLTRIATTGHLRIRTYDPAGQRTFDSFAAGRPGYTLRDPEQEVWQRDVARAMDRAIDTIVMAPRRETYFEPSSDVAAAWPEVRAAQRGGGPVTQFRYAADRTPVLSVAVRDPDRSQTLLVMGNQRDITRTVRAERLRFAIVMLAAALASILLSLFLARTIVRPLRRLARAAVRVRLGRAREVTVPRLPSRRDEIGTLARALSDMTQALRERIDAGEHFAADVTHELKNPLASLRSAIDGLDRVEDPALRAQLLSIAADDVRRLDRLVTDISEASRMDAELSRSTFTRIDIGALVEGLIAARRVRAAADTATDSAGDAARTDAPRIAFARPLSGIAEVMGEPSRLERAVANLLDNALSFSPPRGVVRIDATCSGDTVLIRIEDDGPGVPQARREAIFQRFHSDRPDDEAFGQHSGLGLAIARAIVEAHQGTIAVEDREDGARGASFAVRLPAARCGAAPA